MMEKNNNPLEASGSSKRSLGLPFVLHRLLDEVETEGNANIISWVAKGKAFKGRNMEQ